MNSIIEIETANGEPAAINVGDTMVRPAKATDWPAIWQIMKAVAGAGDTFTYPKNIAEKNARTLWMNRAGKTIVATDAAGRILGTAKMGANQMGPGSHVATASFMVAIDARGRGVGRKLGNAVVGWAEASGFRAIQFNAVVSTNVAAVALWRSLGFAIVGTIPEAFSHPTLGDVSLHVMHRRL